MNLRSSQTSPGEPPAPAPASARGRGRGNRRTSGRGGRGRATSAVPAAAPAAAVPPVPIRLDASTATVVDASNPLADLPCQAVLGGLGGSEPQTDADRVFLSDGKCLGGFGSVGEFAFSPSVGKLLVEVPPTSTESNWAAAGAEAESLLQGGTSDGSLTFRQKLARSVVAGCLVRLALGAGILRASEGCVLPPSELEITMRTPANMGGAPSAPAPASAAPAPAPAAAAQAAGADATGEERGLLSKLVSLLQKPPPAPAVDLATSDDENDAADERIGAFFTTPHPHWEVSEFG